MRIYKLISLAGMVAAVCALSACDVSTPSKINVGKIILQDEMVTETLDASRVEQGRVNILADGFMRKGKGGMVLNVPYIAADNVSKMVAETNGDRYARAFKKRGISNCSVVMVPVAGAQYTDKIVVTYNTLAAKPPAGCERIPGDSGTENMQTIDEYRYGCNVQTEISQMVADPSDLLGKGGTQNNDSRRTGTMIEPYKAGMPNKPMEGYQASGIGG